MSLSGTVGLATQSGGIGNAILLNFKDMGIGISKWAATDNEVDLDLLNFVDYLVEDPSCATVVVYAEAVKSG